MGLILNNAPTTNDAPPIYYPTSIAAGVGGAQHIRQAWYRGRLPVTLHPLQMMGLVDASAHAAESFRSASWGRDLGEPFYPAAPSGVTWPPLVPLVGGPRDPRFMV